MRLTYLVLYVQCGCNTGLSIYTSLLPPDQASRLLCSLRGTLAQSALVDNVVVLQVAGTLSIDCATCEANATVSHFFQLHVARQQAVNKKCNTLCLSRSGPTFTSLDTFIHMAVSLHAQYVGHTGQVLHVGKLHMSCNAHASHTTTPI